MKFRFTFFLFFCAVACVLAQPINLVPNGGFEERIECIWNDSNVKDAPPWFNPMDLEFENWSTPDVFHDCVVINDDSCQYPEFLFFDFWGYGVPVNTLGCEEAFDGVGYAGAFFFYPNFALPMLDGYREYLAVWLMEPMQANVVYDVSMQLSLAERTTHAIWNVQVLFSADSIVQPTTQYMPYEPQLHGSPGDYIDNYNGWRKMEWEYTAVGGEQYMYIGNFQPNSLTDTLRVHSGSTFQHYSPATYYYIDDVRVEYEPLNVHSREKASVELYPNPCGAYLVIKSDEPFFKFEVWNHLGQAQQVPFKRSGISMILDTSGLIAGLYIIRFGNQGFSAQQKFVKR